MTCIPERVRTAAARPRGRARRAAAAARPQNKIVDKSGGSGTGETRPSSAIKSRARLLLPYQRQWIADHAQVKVCEKSRRVGLTWCEAADRALSAASQSGMDTWYIGYNKDMALRVRRDRRMVGARIRSGLRAAIEEIAVDDERRDILAIASASPRGTKSSRCRSRPSNLRGKQGCAVIDEAAFHEDLQGLLKAALAFTMWGGACASSRPTTAPTAHSTNWSTTSARAGGPIRCIASRSRRRSRRDCIIKNRASASTASGPGGRSRVGARAGGFYGDNADEELHCIPRASAGAFLSSVLIESADGTEVPVIRWEMPAEFGERSEEVRRAETAAFLERSSATDPRGARSGAADLLRRGLRAPRRPYRDLATASHAQPETAHPVRGRVAQHPVPAAGADPLLYSGSDAAA